MGWRWRAQSRSQAATLPEVGGRLDEAGGVGGGRCSGTECVAFEICVPPLVEDKAQWLIVPGRAVWAPCCAAA